MGATGPHFSDAELRCKCGCGENGMQQSAIDLWESIRSNAEKVFGMGRVRVKVDSAYRCEAHNIAIKGALNSKHMHGLAIDGVLEVANDYGGKGAVKWNTVAPALWESIVRESPLLGGIGRSDEGNFIHADSRSERMSSQPIQWCYSGGQEVAYYKPKQIGEAPKSVAS
jgi:hypothetical protein